MAPGASSTNGGFREFYAPRATEPPTTSERQMPRVEHQKAQEPIKLRTLHGSAHRTKPDDDKNRMKTGVLGEIKNYRAGDEFVLLWKWVDDFMNSRRAKDKSSKSQNVKNPTSRQPKPNPSSSRGPPQVSKPATMPSPEARRRQATEREDMREYQAQRHTPWGELFYLYHSWKDQQAKKKADEVKRKETSRRQAAERRQEPTRRRSTERRAPLRTTPSPPDQDHAAGSEPSIARKVIPVYNKKTGEVPKHAVKINQLPPIHNSVHLEHTPSNNYRAKPAPTRGQKLKASRETRFSDFLHEERNPAPSRETRFSSILDPAKAIKRAKEAEKAKGPACYICGSSKCPGGYRDHVTDLWVCEVCQKREKMLPIQCSLCGQPNSPLTGYADSNGLWMCTACRCPTTPKELPPTPKLSRKATSRPKGDDTKHCECDTPCPPIESFDHGRTSICPLCRKPLTPFPAIPPKSALRLDKRSSYSSRFSQGVPISEYNSDHLYSDDSYEPPQGPVGLGITFRDLEEEEEEQFRPTPPLKDSRYYHESQDMDYNQSYLRQPGTKHPYAPSPALATSTKVFNPTTYPYPSPPSTPPSLHKPRPASSVYSADEPAADFPYPPPPIPQRFANRPNRSSSVTPGTLSKAALARTGTGSLRSQSSGVSTEGGKTVLNRRSSWYDFWKPVFEKTGERSF